MKLRYYLRGLGLGVLVAALVMGFSGTGPTKADASQTEDADRSDKATLADLAPAPEAEAIKNALDKDSDEAGEETNDALGDTESGAAADAGTSDEDMAEAEADEAGDSREDTEGTAEEGEAGDTSEAVDVYSGTDDAPGTRAARGQTTSGDSGSRNAKGQTEAQRASEQPKSQPASQASKGPDLSNLTKLAESQDNSGSNNSNKGGDSSSKVGGAAQAPAATLDQTAPAGQSPTVSSTSKVTISVYPGEGSYTVSRKLAAAGLVESADVYDTFLCQNGYDKRIRTGNYDITMGASPEDIARVITGR